MLYKSNISKFFYVRTVDLIHTGHRLVGSKAHVMDIYCEFHFSFNAIILTDTT